MRGAGACAEAAPAPIESIRTRSIIVPCTGCAAALFRRNKAAAQPVQGTMMLRVLMLSIGAGAASAQAPAPRMEFEVASIKPSPPITAGGPVAGVHVDGALVTL